MKKYIFLSPEGSTVAPNPQCKVKNMQVIGIVDNVANEDEALKKLLMTNSWIFDAHFNVANFVVYQLF